jgi:peptidoglycan/LPS O-acetylase OafA/YrhL
VAPFNIVTWSLFYEMTFYLAFPLLLIALRNRVAVTLLGVAAPVAAVLAGADALALCWSLLFAGVALAHAGDAWPRIPTPVVVAAYLAITTLAAFDALPPVVAVLAFAIVAAALVRLCVLGPNLVARAFASRPMRALGRVSYSFYLVHWMIVVLVARAAEGTSPAVATAAIFAGGFVLSAAGASALWWIAERPYFEYARRLKPRE